MDIVIRECLDYDEREVLSLYKSVGWSAYYSRPEVLKRAFSRSLCVLAAYVQGELAGLIRAVGDGETVVFVQDLLVKPEFQRRGVGRRLAAQLLDRYRHVRQLHLLTDDTPQTTAFYKAVGLTPAETIRCKAFTRLRS